LCALKLPLPEYYYHLDSIEHQVNEQNKIYCEACNKYFIPSGYTSHIITKRHMNKAEKLKNKHPLMNDQDSKVIKRKEFIPNSSMVQRYPSNLPALPPQFYPNYLYYGNSYSYPSNKN